MYDLEQIKTEKNEMRQVVLNARASTPFTIRSKIERKSRL
jgi:hypothetical protein